MAFTNEQLERYSRHIILKEVGAKGQKKLLNAKVLIIGAGGLGAPAAMYLAAAGVGTIGIADADVVDLSNLQRQIIHATKDVGKLKVQSAKETMNEMNPDVTVNTYHTFVTSENILDLIKDYDFVIDGTDNFPAKFLINDACVMAKKPFSHAGIIRFQGQLMTYVPGQGPCYRCVFKEPSERCRADLQAGGRYRRHGRCHRKPPGNGSGQVHPRHRQPAHRLLADVQCADHGIPQGQIADQDRRLRGLRYAPDHHAAD